MRTPTSPTASRPSSCKCLAKNPANRYATADELRADLVASAQGQPGAGRAGPPAAGAPTHGRPVAAGDGRAHGGAGDAAPVPCEPRPYAPRRTGWFLVVVLLLLLVVLGGLLFAVRPAARRSSTRTAATVAVPDVRRRPDRGGGAVELETPASRPAGRRRATTPPRAGSRPGPGGRPEVDEDSTVDALGQLRSRAEVPTSSASTDRGPAPSSAAPVSDVTRQTGRARRRRRGAQPVAQGRRSTRAEGARSIVRPGAGDQVPDVRHTALTAPHHRPLSRAGPDPERAAGWAPSPHGRRPARSSTTSPAPVVDAAGRHRAGSPQRVERGPPPRRRPRAPRRPPSRHGGAGGGGGGVAAT